MLLSLIFCHPFEVAGSRVGKTGHLDHIRFYNYCFFLLWWSSVFIMFCVLAKFKILFYSPKTFRVKPKSLEEFLNMVVGLFFFSWSFWKHWWSRTAPGLQPNKVFNATVLFFVGIFFWLVTKRTQHQNIRVPGNNVRYLGVSVLVVFCVRH